MHETRSTMRRSFSLRSHFALLIALLVTLLSWLLGSLIGNDASQRIREEVGRDLVEASLQMIDRLDRDIDEMTAMLEGYMAFARGDLGHRPCGLERPQDAEVVLGVLQIVLGQNAVARTGRIAPQL